MITGIGEWILGKLGEKLVDIGLTKASDAAPDMARKLKGYIREVTGTAIKASDAQFCLVISPLLNDDGGSHARYISAVFSKMRNIEIITDDEIIPMLFTGKRADAEARIKLAAKSVLERCNGDVVIFGEVLLRHTSVRLSFVSRLGASELDEDPFIFEDAKFSGRFREVLATLAVREVADILYQVQQAKDRGQPYRFDRGLNKLTSIERDNLLRDGSYRLAYLFRIKMEVLLQVYLDNPELKTIEDAISRGRKALEIYQSSQYEYAATALRFCKCLYYYTAAKKDQSILDEMERLCRVVIGLDENPPADFDFTPFEGRRNEAFVYVLSRNLGSQKAGDTARMLLAQGKLLTGILNWDVAQIKIGTKAVQECPPSDPDFGLSRVDASVVLARALRDPVSRSESISAVQQEIESEKIPKAQRELSLRLQKGDAKDEILRDREFQRLSEYWRMQKEGHLRSLLALANNRMSGKRITVGLRGELLEAPDAG